MNPCRSPRSASHGPSSHAATLSTCKTACRPSRGAPGIRGSRSFESEEAPHVLIVLFLPVFRAQVQAQLVDDLDGIVAEPIVPAVGTDLFVDLLPDRIGHRRPGQLFGLADG